MDKQNRRKKIIEEICREKGIEKVDISYDWISILKKGNIEKRLIDYNFYLNNQTSVKLTKDKFSTYELLHYYKIPIIEHKVLFNEKIMPNIEFINADYEVLKNDKKQVLKASDLSEGRDIYVCDNGPKKIQIVKDMFEKGIEEVVVCPFMDIAYEYRVLFLYGEVIYIYKKQKPFVIGDGKLNLQELIKKDLKYLMEPVEGLDFDYIPAKNEEVVVGWKHNLSNGAIPLVVDENDFYYEEVKNLALKVGKVMDLNFASIDVMVTKNEEVFVMEVNSSVMISKFCELMPNGYEIGKEIYEKVIDKIFEKGEKNENKK